MYETWGRQSSRVYVLADHIRLAAGVVGNFVSRVRGYDSLDPPPRQPSVRCRRPKSTSGHCPADGINYATAAAVARVPDLKQRV